MKKILVNSCENCYKLAIKWNEERRGYTDYVCRVQNKTVEKDTIILDKPKIPAWCPLPEDS